MRWRPLLSILLATSCTSADHRADISTPGAHTRTDTGSVQANIGTPAVDSAQLVSSTEGADSSAGVAEGASATDSSSEEVRFDPAGHPIVPIVFHNSCEGEDCGTQFMAVACLPTVLHAARADSTVVVRPVAAGETLRVVQRDLVVRKVGAVVVTGDFVLDHDWVEAAGPDVKVPRPDTVRFARGDTLYLLRYLALGRWSWALHSRIHASDEFWAAAPEPGLGGAGDDSTLAVARSTPLTEDWWLVQSPPRPAGWWRADDRPELQSIGGMEHWNDDCDQVRARAAK